MTAADERLPRGPKGDKGEPGMSRGARRGLVGLLVLMLLLGGANLLFTAHYVNTTQANARKAGQAIEAKLCSTLDRLAALMPPAGNPQANPSRAFEQDLHATLAQLGPDIGCR